MLNQTTIDELRQAAREYKSEGEKAVREAERIEAFLTSVVPNTNGHLRSSVPPAVKEKVLRLSQKGINSHKIAQMLGLPAGTTYSIVNRAKAELSGVPAKFRRGRHAFTPEDVRNIRKLLAQGMTQAAIAKKYKVHFTMISGIARRVTYAWVK